MEAILTGKGTLLRILGLAFGLAAVIGHTIGQGILRSPGVVADSSSSPGVIIGLWVLGGVVVLISAVAYAELGAAIPRAGGTYAYVTRAFGNAAGTFTGLAILVGQMTSLALMTYIIGEFLVRLGVGGGTMDPAWLGLGALGLMCLVNLTGTRIAGMSQVTLSVAKVFILLGLVIVLFAQPGVSPPPVATPAPLLTGWQATATALLLVMNTYGGWQSLTYYGEELTDPGRTIPRSLFTGILAVSVIYILINMAMLHVLTPAQMSASTLPAADAAAIVFGAKGDIALTMFGLLSVAAIANFFVMSSSRMAFALARGGSLPIQLSYVARNGTPHFAVGFIAVIAALFIVTGSYVTLATTTTSVTQFNFVATLACVFALRRKEPELERPYRAPFYPWFPLFAIILSVAILLVFIVKDPWNALAGFALVGVLLAMDLAAKAWFRSKR
jgi:APA family basic amino acid/polyamine antiporter